jgi:hypothetical protein
VLVKVTTSPTHAGFGVAVKFAVAVVVPVMLILSTYRLLPFPDRFLNATITEEFPTYGVKLTVSVLHCAAPDGLNEDVVAAAVARVVLDLL